MKNRELFVRDPLAVKLMNDGVAAVNEGRTEKEEATLRFELEHFVCEGQYRSGMIRILESCLSHADATVQPAAWVSGFFGSGKSHLLKMLRHLWVNTTFKADGATARGLAHLPVEVTDLLRELDTLSRRAGGLHAAAGTLPSGGGESVRLAILGILFRSMGLPTSYPQARFWLWLKKNNIFEQISAEVEKSGKSLLAELDDLYVSPVIAKALEKVYPDFAPNAREVRSILKNQFPVVQDISTADFIHTIRQVLPRNGQLPLTVLVLDEVQLFIGDSTQRSTEVQEVAEALCKQLDSRLLLIGSGQTALAGSVPLLQRLRDRFTIAVELSDTDVETVTRRVVLAKKADKRKTVEQVYATHAGEIDRHLIGTRIGPKSEDRTTIVDDYPLLPVRRRFWESVLRAVDIPGTASQLRTQLRVVYDAVREIGEKPVGTVTPADFIFEEQRANMLQSGVLLREIDETIQGLDDGSADGRLAKRLCSLIFLIRKLPREQVADIGVRATPEMLADLLIEDLAGDGASLRQRIPVVLDRLSEQGKLIRLDDEYSLQTRESAEWDREFRNRQTRIAGDLTWLSQKRTTLLGEACDKLLSAQKLLHGKSRYPRKLLIHYGPERPSAQGHEIPVWIRDGWGESEKSVIDDSRADGSDSPIIYVYIPKASADDLKKALIDHEAAQRTLEFKGTPSTDEGRDARDAMATRLSAAADGRKRMVEEVVNNARVFQGGGNERLELDLVEKVRHAAEASMDRLFPRFHAADDAHWPTVITRAKSGDEAALQAIGWQDAAQKHPVCAAILSRIGAGKSGREIRGEFEDAPCGWPRDAIDAALMVLHTSGHLRVHYKGELLAIGHLDQNRIPMADFRVESATLSAQERIRLRGLYQLAGIHCKSGEEGAKAAEFLLHLSDLAQRAGGEPPLPERPSRSHIEFIRTLAGNEQLQAILAQSAELQNNLSEWSSLADLAEQRMAAWLGMQRLIAHGSDLDLHEIEGQLEAIRKERRLLEPHNPLQALRQQLLDLLRKALREQHGAYQARHDELARQIAQNAEWQKLTPEQQKQILRDNGLDDIPGIETGDEAGLLKSLDSISLSSWKTRIQALPQQFSAALLAAARLLQPKTRTIRLASQTLATPEDVKRWLGETEQELMQQIRKGPILIS
ncbi:MAG TPA: BREX system P-loop protein BrxC [bacterium]|nr:BREX system P-loop protein BrxC [bacterium]